MGAVEDLKLRLQLRAAFRDLDKVSFGGACCDDCKKTGGSCGGAPSAACCAECARTGAGTVAKPCGPCKVSFGAFSDTAPEPPQVGTYVTEDDLKSYASYVDQRVSAMDRAYNAWFTPIWDGPTGTCTPQQYGQFADAEQQIGQQQGRAAEDAYVEQVSQYCYPESNRQSDLALKWSNQISGSVGDSSSVGWTAWSIGLHNYVKEILSAGAITLGSYPTLLRLHQELIQYAKAADGMGLQGVPDPGKPSISPSVAQTANEIGRGVGNVAGNVVGGVGSGLTDSLGGILILGGLGLVGYLALAGRGRR